MKNPSLQKETDAAQRIVDAVSLALIANSDILTNVGKWMAFKLEDGSTDHVIYDSKQDALDDKKSRCKDFCYLKIDPHGIPLKHAMHFLKINRHPLIDTTAPEHVINPAIYPRFSNLTPEQKQTARLAAEAEWRKRQ
jgi:hypothetical protein